ncbi:MAG: DUF1697 domain-containing protein [Thermoleophilia bacterium]|nr:DUF1697 domain-containing protein [Thermoleophilia bacterium]
MAQLAFLLRGINVGTAKSIAMAELRAAVEAAGFEQPRTLLRSGNLVAHTDLPAREAERALEEVIRDSFSMDVGVVTRTRGDLARLISDAPLAGVADNPSRHVVAFFSQAPPAADLAAFADATEAPDAALARTRELVLWVPAGQTGSPAAQRLAKLRLPGVVTVRNWNTITKLLAVFDAPGA